MKRSAAVAIPLLLAMAACSRNRRPCDMESFDERRCKDELTAHPGWFPHTFSYYYNDYYLYHHGGGYAHGVYISPRSVGRASSSSSTGISRGIFGGTGSGHSASGGGE